MILINRDTNKYIKSYIIVLSFVFNNERHILNYLRIKNAQQKFLRVNNYRNFFVSCNIVSQSPGYDASLDDVHKISSDPGNNRRDRTNLKLKTRYDLFGKL